MVFVFFAVIIVFGVAMLQLFDLRFKSGEHLPPYSSLRTDPLGSKAFYESLARFDQLQLTRHYKNLSRLEPNSRTAVFFLGLPADALSIVDRETSNRLDQIMVAGGRTVITLFPDRPRKISNDEEDEEEVEEKPEPDKPEPDKPEKDVFEDKEEKKDGDKKSEGKDASDIPNLISLQKHWDFELELDPTPHSKDGLKASGRLEAASWPNMSWHSGIYFTKLGPAWHALYDANGKPVIIWRQWGQGTLVLASDSYFVSNEALRNEPRPALLSWLVGDKTRLVFNETHLGMYESPGVATLARQYGLGGVLVGLLVLAILFIWKNAFSLAPPPDSEIEGSDGVISAGRDYYAGLISLLQRNIPANRILRECFKAYRRTTEERRENLGDALSKAEAVLGPDTQSPRNDPVAGYRTIQQIIAEKKSWKKTPSS